MSCRAVHVELAHSLSSDSFIQALRRFICRRGQVVSITSDNGTNFIGAQQELNSSIDEWNKKVESWCRQNSIVWHFNPPYSSHFGGVFERQIRSIRKIFQSILTEQNVRLSDEDLLTFMCEAEAVLNNRPLTELSDDPTDCEALTPNHLLLLNAGVTFPPGLFSPNDQYVRKRWKQTQFLVNLFWTRWRNEYMVLLQKRQKWSKSNRPHKVGDLVLVQDISLPRNQWPLGRIEETRPSNDGNVRSAVVRIAKKLSDFSTTLITRPIVKLILLRSVEELT